MGKNGKKQRQQQKPTARDRNYYLASDDDDSYFVNHPTNDDDDNDNDNDNDNDEQQQQQVEETHSLIPSKFSLYQQSVQSPKGDISYLQKFFLMYVGGRAPLHLQEDFCGTALLSTEWLRTDSRRTAVGLDLDLEAIMWCMQNNIENIGSDNSSRISLFHGNVLQPHEAKLVKLSSEDLIQNITIEEAKDDTQDTPAKVPSMSERDIVCAFNYSCCCLHNRKELVSYFKHARDCLSKKGGIFVMDVYGGMSSERELKLQRKFPNFTYTWEQAEFDVIQRKTRISLHYQLHKPQKKIRNAFSFNWRLWSLPELRDCLEEAGFKAVHFWIREMPDTETNRSTQGFGNSRDDKYEEVSGFQQLDAWNAYIVAVA